MRTSTLVAPRRFYYGWALVGTLAATETVSWDIVYYAFAVFLVPMEAELGWSRAVLTGAYSLAIAGLAAIPVGRWLDRHGPRALMTADSIAAVLLLLAWSAVGSVGAFYLIWAALGLVMAAILYEPAFAAVATWFERERGKALLLLTFVAGFASTIFLPLASRLVGALGWRQALLALAGILAVLTIPAHALVLRRRPEDLGLLPDGQERRGALGDAAFWWLSGSIILGTVTVVALGVHLVPLLRERGYGADTAALATGALGALSVTGRVLITALIRRLPQALVTAALLALQSIAVLVLLAWDSPAGLVLFVILFGLGFGALTLARAGLIAEWYGRKHYGAIGGALALCTTGARALAPVGAGALYVWAGGYGQVLICVAVVAALAALAMIGAQFTARPLATRTSEEHPCGG
ncbi:MAG TPA: MFS transporter [Nitrolancea sp.]|nr:MFS transporter [Nitrolancea sp.]